MTTVTAETEAGTASAPAPLLSAGRLEHAAARAWTERLFVEQGRMVAGLCRGLLRDGIEAEDAAQQAFLSAYRAILRGAEPREPAAWVAAIARNECLARIRERMRRPLPADDVADTIVSDSDPLSEALRRADMTALWAAVSALAPQQREALLLREFGGLSYDELGVALGVSVPAVESLLFRARTRLRGELKEAFAAANGAGWLSALRELAPRFLGAGGVAKVAAATVGAGVLAGGAVVGERELVPHAPPRAATPAAVAPARVVARPPTVAATPVAAAASEPTHRRRAKHRIVFAPISVSGSDSAGSRDGGRDGSRDTRSRGVSIGDTRERRRGDAATKTEAGNRAKGDAGGDGQPAAETRSQGSSDDSSGDGSGSDRAAATTVSGDSGGRDSGGDGGGATLPTLTTVLDSGGH